MKIAQLVAAIDIEFKLRQLITEFNKLFDVANNRGTIDLVAVNTTLTSSHGTVLVDATSGNITITLPTSVDFRGWRYNIKKIDASANTVTVNGDGTNIDDVATYTLTTQYQSVTVQRSVLEWFIL